MISVVGYAAHKAKEILAPIKFDRRDVGPRDILIEIDYCGVCHSDIHQAREEWGPAIFPMVPGHEIVGKVTKIGNLVGGFKVGEIAGVGCFVDSCRKCSSCLEGEEQYCEKHLSQTYNGTEQDERTPTYGGYSSCIVVDEKYALHVSPKLDLTGVAPLLCAGITTYSPLRHWKIGKGHKIGVVGLGGLGHMAVKFGAAMGAEVTVLSTSPNKGSDAKRLGAHNFVLTSDEAAMKSTERKLDFIIDAVSAQHPMDSYLNLLKRDGTLVLVGVPPQLQIAPFSLLVGRRSLAGSIIGGIRETQEMLNFCAEKNIISDVEMIPIQKVNEAYERTIKGDVRYRFVIDMKSLSQ